MDIRKSDIRALQSHLIAETLLDGTADGVIGANTENAVGRFLEGRGHLHTLSVSDLSDARRHTLALQIACKEAGFPPGPIDGYYGPLAQHAAMLLYRRYFGVDVIDLGAIDPLDVNPNGFPRETIADLNNYYGALAPGCNAGEIKLAKVDCPWFLRLDWDLTKGRQHFNVHEKVAESVNRAVQKIFSHYGLAEIRRLNLDRFSGDYNPRLKVGGSTCSTHAWGIAIDFYGSKNRLNQSTSDSSPPTLAHPDLNFWWQTWEEEGWYSLGRMEDRDWMHIQAAKRKQSAHYWQ